MKSRMTKGHCPLPTRQRLCHTPRNSPKILQIMEIGLQLRPLRTRETHSGEWHRKECLVYRLESACRWHPSRYGRRRIAGPSPVGQRCSPGPPPSATQSQGCRITRADRRPTGPRVPTLLCPVTTRAKMESPRRSRERVTESFPITDVGNARVPPTGRLVAPSPVSARTSLTPARTASSARTATAQLSPPATSREAKENAVSARSIINRLTIIAARRADPRSPVNGIPRAGERWPPRNPNDPLHPTPLRPERPGRPSPWRDAP